MEEIIEKTTNDLIDFVFDVDENMPSFSHENYHADVYILKLFTIDYILFYTLQKHLETKSNIMKEIYTEFFDEFKVDNLSDYIDYWFNVYAKEINEPSHDNLAVGIGTAYAILSAKVPEEITPLGAFIAGKFQECYNEVRHITNGLFLAAN